MQLELQPSPKNWILYVCIFGLDNLYGERQNVKPSHTAESDFEHPVVELEPRVVELPVELFSEDEETEGMKTPALKRYKSLSDDSVVVSTKKVKKDFSSLYAENTALQITLSNSKFQFEKEQREKELALMEARLKFDEETQKSNQRGEIIKSLILQGTTLF